MRCYEEQKRSTVSIEMASELNSGFTRKTLAQAEQIRNSFMANKVDAEIEEALIDERHTLESLRQEAMVNKRVALLELDQHIALVVGN